MVAYYNEHDAYAAAWLRNLIAAGHIAPGIVDERDIRDVRPSDLDGFTQCHFFAGIGVWSYALRLAGWPDDRPIWTGSCPCQPFSAAGGRGGFADERHLWPSWHHLIRERRPAIVLGEQVASKDGLGWLDLVQVDMEGSGYACGAIDLCAAGVGAPHIRQRLWLLAVAESLSGRAGRLDQGSGRERGLQPRDGGLVRLVGDAPGIGCEGRQPLSGSITGRIDAGAGAAFGMADADGRDASAEREHRGGQHGLIAQDGGAVPHRWPGAHHGGWNDADWLRCRDDKWRPVEPGTFPLAHGAPARVGRLRAYGNAINAEAAAAFIRAADGALFEAECVRLGGVFA